MLSVSPSKIVCVGRNYVKHAAELGNEVPSEPLIFLKAPSAILSDGEPIVMPRASSRVDYEGEIGLVIGRRARKVSVDDAWSCVEAVVPVNDVTARDLQKKDGQWTRAKGFDTFCPVGTPVPVDRVDREALAVVTRVNGEVRQQGSASEMAFSIPVLISYISHIMTLEPGDLIATGTPEGIGPLASGDEVEVEVAGVGAVRNPVREEAP
ncbi:MAG: fumarylacetoacetate hydrolase family protein [Gemmatimonadota bacterium]|jgi:2-keto-4-pentenoate hydratase/2-oxohepta-3-ene-1,7-dioic acid hydratase in catechol pathway